ncbi:MAG: hypothetical protein EHM48_06990 [Planctomycetaceae bacterium]|nr:MAG: hypothetical protein EHM48_06990 [Planctomycetaceae bacterium]
MIYRLAGIIGVNPGPLTLRELLWMAEGLGETAWSHTSALLAAVWSGNQNMKKPRFFAPAEFNPYLCQKAPKQGIRITADNIGLLKMAILGNQPE